MHKLWILDAPTPPFIHLMNRHVKSEILVFAMVCAACFSGCNAQNEVCFSIEQNPFVQEPAFSEFTKYINVLGCFHVVAEPGINDLKVLHVAAVAAELLDQNEDGVVDDPMLEASLIQGQALMPVLSFEGSDAEQNLFDFYEGDGISAVLYSGEIDPNEPGYWGSDATVEEVLHTINHVGHVVIYPDAFSLAPNSSLLSAAMDVARGGQFIVIPDDYPEEAWYHYDDETCDYECMAIEYLYWAIVTEMGILNDPMTAEGIADEWELSSPDLLESTDYLIHALINDPAYMIPLVAPDGNYCPEAVHAVDLQGTDPELIQVLNLLGQQVEGDFEGIRLQIFDDGSVRKVISLLPD